MPKVLVENTSKSAQSFYGAMLQPGESRWLEAWPDQKPAAQSAVSMSADGKFYSAGEEVTALSALVSGAGKRIRSMLGAEAFDLVGISGLPAGASFSGAGSYNNAGILAVQSTGTITHNPTGWYDGTACLEFTPNANTSCEFRIFNAAGLNISDDDGLAFEFEVPEVDTSLQNFSINFQYSSDAVDNFPANLAGLRVWICDQANNQSKEKSGRKYIRQRWDHDATAANSGAWPGYAPTTVGAGADRKALVKHIRFTFSKFGGKTVKLKAVRRGGRSTPCFVIGSDNANPDTLFDRGFAYMASKGLPGYLAQYLSFLNSNAAALSGYRRAYAAGHEITGDDVVDRPLGSTVLDEAGMRAAVEGTRDGLKALGFTRSSRAWVANNNNTSYLMIRELARAGYVCNRNGVTDGIFVFPEGGVPDAFRLPAQSIDNMNWTAIQPIIDRAILTGCTLWIYFHGMLSSARLDEDRTANVTGTVGAPIARSGTESLTAYRARAAALGTAAGNASVVYFDARIGSGALGIWWEEFKPLADYLATKSGDKSCVVLSPDEWCREVGLLT